jgi:hypothetical protein
MPDVQQSTPVESDLLAPLVEWLRARRQVRPDAILLEEFPWHGRRVDLALLTASGISAAYELKLAHNRRAIEQSYLNSISFDRTYLVTATRPTEPLFEQAVALGVGIIHVTLATGRVSQLLASRRASIHPMMRRKLRRAFAHRESTHV